MGVQETILAGSVGLATPLMAARGFVHSRILREHGAAVDHNLWHEPGPMEVSVMYVGVWVSTGVELRQQLSSPALFNYFHPEWLFFKSYGCVRVGMCTAWGGRGGPARESDHLYTCMSRIKRLRWLHTSGLHMVTQTLSLKLPAMYCTVCPH